MISITEEDTKFIIKSLGQTRSEASRKLAQDKEYMSADEIREYELDMQKSERLIDKFKDYTQGI